MTPLISLHNATGMTYAIMITFATMIIYVTVTAKATVITYPMAQ